MSLNPVSDGSGVDSRAIRTSGLSTDGGSADEYGRSTCAGSVPHAANPSAANSNTVRAATRLLAAMRLPAFTVSAPRAAAPLRPSCAQPTARHVERWYRRHPDLLDRSAPGPRPTALSGLFRGRDAERRGHIHEVRQRAGLHLPHQAPAVRLHG